MFITTCVKRPPTKNSTTACLSYLVGFFWGEGTESTHVWTRASWLSHVPRPFALLLFGQGTALLPRQAYGPWSSSSAPTQLGWWACPTAASLHSLFWWMHHGSDSNGGYAGWITSRTRNSTSILFHIHRDIDRDRDKNYITHNYLDLLIWRQWASNSEPHLQPLLWL
jgi:hypothetical protein